jgi:hypothetical protein
MTSCTAPRGVSAPGARGSARTSWRRIARSRGSVRPGSRPAAAGDRDGLALRGDFGTLRPCPRTHRGTMGEGAIRQGSSRRCTVLLGRSTNDWGRLAALSNLLWTRVQDWVSRGRPLSLIVLDALAELIPYGGKSPLFQQLGPKLRECADRAAVPPVLQSYMAVDSAPRVIGTCRYIIARSTSCASSSDKSPECSLRPSTLRRRGCDATPSRHARARRARRPEDARGQRAPR